LGIITALAAATWLIGLQFLWSSAKKGQPSEGTPHGRSEDSEASASRRLVGSAEVDGEASSLAAKAASLLAKGTVFPFFPVKIMEKSEDHIRFEPVGPGGGGQSPLGWFRQGLLWFTPLGQGRTRADWAAELTDTGRQLWLGGLFQVLGLIALVVGFWAIHTYVVSSPDPAERWQTVQMLQVSHFLWPPFLFGALYRRGRQEVAARFEALVHNLPYFGD